MAVKRISDLDNAVSIQDTDLLAIVNGGATRKTTVADLNTVILNSSNPRRACRLAATANIDLSTGGLLTIDGVLLQSDDRVLVWRQTNAAQNGIYAAKAGAWTRAFDFDETSEIRSGALIPVVQGNTYKQSIFQLTNIGSIIIGTTAITFARLTGWQFNETTNIVSLTDRALHIPSVQINGGLAKYDAERHSEYDARTLVDKEYVDDRVGGLDPQWATAGNNVYYDAGNVGIGVSAPTADLHLQGSFKFIDGNQQNGKVLTSDAAGNATWQPIPVNALWSPGAGNNIYYNLGSVGIGTANPAHRLHIVGGNVAVDNGGVVSQGGNWSVSLGTSGQPAAPAKSFGIHSYFQGQGGASFFAMSPFNPVTVFDYFDSTFGGTRPWLANMSPAANSHGALSILPNSTYLTAFGARVMVDGPVNGGQQSRVFKGYETFFNTTTNETYATYNDQMGFSAVMAANNSQLKGFYADVQSSAVETWAFYAKNGKSRFTDVFLATAPVNDNALTQVLVRDNSTGQIKYRDAATLGGGGGGVSAASETTAGIAEIATQAEASAGIDDVRFITPLKLKTVLLNSEQVFDTDRKFFEQDDFSYHNQTILSAHWQQNNSTALGTNNSGINTIENAFGVVAISTATSATGVGYISKTNVTNAYLIGGGNSYRVRFRAAIQSALSNGTDTFTIRIGFNDNPAVSGDANDGAYFRYTHSVNGGKWQAVTRVGGVETSEDTGIAPVADVYQIFEIRINANGSQVDFYIDNVLTNDITTNIPTGESNLTTIISKIEKSAGTTARLLLVDWYDFLLTRTAPR